MTPAETLFRVLERIAIELKAHDEDRLAPSVRIERRAPHACELPLPGDGTLSQEIAKRRIQLRLGGPRG